MAYEITLTREERKAIDFIGYRYSNGNQLRDLLIEGHEDPEEITPERWDSDEDITFNVSKINALDIRQNAADEEGSFPLFSDELVMKMFEFIEKIIY